MRLPERAPGQLLIGVAVTIPEPFGTQLQAARARFGDRWADFIPPHVTLLAPTVIEPGLVPQVRAHLDAVATRHRPFTLRLRGTGTFRPVSQVAFVQVADGIAACEQLESEVRTGPLEQSLRFHYHPHVTVAHDLPDERLDEAMDELGDFDASFVVDRLHCYRCGDDAVWRPELEHLLTGADDAAAT
ncbi:2'-5' RNA ligase family protein [Cellulomonas composti]|uniref:Phosphoesterase n=1 Tax=Cellulomonas composti TaxID=266130 RepID=A0A511JCF5_9CELL|nr:2'-5' RNA ligase family protein [Cellulomonas composti]GEL95687.1 phosphoesterase [Cellulomonas composti]